MNTSTVMSVRAVLSQASNPHEIRDFLNHDKHSMIKKALDSKQHYHTRTHSHSSGIEFIHRGMDAEHWHVQETE